MVAAWTEVVADGAERTEEALGVLGRLEALKHALSLAGGQVRVLGAVVQTLMASMLGARQDPADGRRVAGQLVRDDHSWLVLTTLQ